MKKISIIGSVGIPAIYGGFETLVEYLTLNLSSDFDITVYCSRKSYTELNDSYNGSRLRYINLNANGVESIFYDILSIFKAIKHSDKILILGISGCIILPFIRFISKVEIITNIDGLEWKRDKWNKVIKFFLKFSERIAVKYSDVVIGDNKVIVDYVKNEYGIDAKLIAYGADHVAKVDVTEELLLKYDFLNNKYAFKVSRIEPENNIHIILEAFYKYKQLNFVIVGNWNNSEYGRDLKEKYSVFENIYLLDPIYDQYILNQLRSNCYLYVHGHSAGGTNPSLVEAMFLELPIICYNVEYNKETTGQMSKYFYNEIELISLLETISEKELLEMKNNMFNNAKDNYTWKAIANKYATLLN